MTREEAEYFLRGISYKLGNIAVEYLSEKDGEKMREAIKALKQEPTIKNDIHCLYTDEEIAQSFKEDVEAVKDLLPTTKNDLGVERQIKEICISYPKSDLKEHDGQPYYSVKYIENGEEYEGYGTYKIEVFMEYLKNYFIPSVTPQLSSGLEKNSKKLEKNFGELDCISRADARSLVVKIDRKYMFGMSGKAFQDLYNEIDDLPSVTPRKPQSFEWCETCKEYDQEKHCCHRWSKVIRDTVEEMKQEPILDELRAEITMLQNRCYALTKGTMCAFCKFECEYKTETEEEDG